MCLVYKVGYIQIASQSAETNSLVSEVLGLWLAERGWIGLVGISTEVTFTSRTRFGFNEAKINFVPGEFQSNEAREFFAEIPFDLESLVEELELWLTEASPSPQNGLLTNANQAESDAWTG